jgi:hypothetical protein
MFRWSKVVQFSVWPFDFPDFVGRALVELPIGKPGTVVMLNPFPVTPLGQWAMVYGVV